MCIKAMVGFLLTTLILSIGSMPTVVECGCSKDWLLNQFSGTVVNIEKNSEGNIVIDNGLILREFTTNPTFGTTDYVSLCAHKSLLRSLNPEGYIVLDSTTYPIGGLTQTGHHSFINHSRMSVLDNAFEMVNYTIGSPIAPYPWTPGCRHAPSNVSWPPEGKILTVLFKPPAKVASPSHAGILVYVNYELYQGVPILAKWMTVKNTMNTPVQVTAITIEVLGTNKPYAPQGLSPQAQPWEHDLTATTVSWLYVEANIPHGASITWESDPSLGDSPGADEPVLNCSYTAGPGVVVSANTNDNIYSQLDRGRSTYRKHLNSHHQNFMKHGSHTDKLMASPMVNEFDTYHVLELITDTFDLERTALSRHRMMRLLAPQTQENPIFFHGTNSTPEGFRSAIDQMAEVGFEMYIYSFGSGFRLEDLSDANIEAISANIKYAQSKGIEVGGYDLIDLERGHGGYGGNVGDQWDAVSATDSSFTKDACFASGWVDKIRGIIFEMINRTGLSMFETDGPYGGGACASKTHDHHVGEADSIYWQTRLQGELYADLRKMNVFINQPDNYFYWGGSKSGMGYNENQYSLPRWEDLSVSRQTMYDNTYHFIPTQGWMFLPLVVYHGGGAAAMFEPLSDNYEDYEWGLAQYFGYGVQACYRGFRLFDSDKVKSLVIKWVAFYKTYRDILTSDIIHVRRPDMQDFDCILHVNPGLQDRGLAMVFNPTSQTISRNISLPLYYTGISEKAVVMNEGVMPGTPYTIDRDYQIELQSVVMEPKMVTWFLIHSGDTSTK